MSELVIGIIIGGVIGIISATLSTIIQGLFSLKNEKNKIEADREEQREKFQHENQQYKLSMLIKLRSKYLVPLKDTILENQKNLMNLGDILGTIISMSDYNLRIEEIKTQKKHYEKGLVTDSEVIMGPAKKFRKLNDKLYQFQGKLIFLRIQLTDSKLDQMIISLHRHIDQLLTKIILLNSDINYPEQSRRKVINLKEIGSILNELVEKHKLTNQRIEELLCGYD